MAKTFINELEKDQMLEEEKFVILSSQKNITKSGSEYYRLEVGDKTGKVQANIWEDSIPNTAIDALVQNEIVSIWGKVEEYKGNKQIKVLSLGAAKEFDPADFILVSDRNPDEMWDELMNHIKTIENEDIKELLRKVFSDKEVAAGFKKHPAATGMHHAFKHGLLEHVMEMLDMSDVVLKYYPEADASLIKAGIIFHDIGKLREIDDNTLSYSRSAEGNLIGHIILGYEALMEYADDDFPADILLKLKHIILSHHGILEYGSPVMPKTIEAIIVHQLDDSSAKIRGYQKIIRLNAENEDEFTKRDFLLGTEIYLK